MVLRSLPRLCTFVVEVQGHQLWDFVYLRAMRATRAMCGVLEVEYRFSARPRAHRTQMLPTSAATLCMICARF